MLKAKQIESIVRTGANHVLYRKDGGWYHHLEEFPGALFDNSGYMIFNTKEEYESNPFLRHRQDLNVKLGISSIPGYIKFTPEQFEKIKALKNVELDILKAAKSDLDSFEDENSGDFEGGAKKRLVNYFERKPKLRAKAIEIHGTTCKVCQFNFKEHYMDYMAKII